MQGLRMDYRLYADAHLGTVNSLPDKFIILSLVSYASVLLKASCIISGPIPFIYLSFLESVVWMERFLPPY